MNSTQDTLEGDYQAILPARLVSLQPRAENIPQEPNSSKSVSSDIVRTHAREVLEGGVKGMKRINTAPGSLDILGSTNVAERGENKGSKRQCLRIREEGAVGGVGAEKKCKSDSALLGMENRPEEQVLAKCNAFFGGNQTKSSSTANQQTKNMNMISSSSSVIHSEMVLSDLSESEMSEAASFCHEKEDELEEEAKKKPRDPYEGYEDPMTVASAVMNAQGWSFSLRSALDEGLGGVRGPNNMFAKSNHIYSLQAVDAVRNHKVDILRELKNSGTDLNASNKFGESLVHMACRRGNLEVLKYLVEEGGCELKRCDDFGRTVLHDAFWTSTPNFELVKYLMLREPGLILVTDKRGHTPLGYARKEHWEFWVKFFKTEGEEIWMKREAKNVVG